MAHALDQLRAGATAKLPDHALAFGPVAGVHAHLEQFMVGQGQLELPVDCFGQACAAYDDHRLQAVPQPAQVPLLTFRKCHDHP